MGRNHYIINHFDSGGLTEPVMDLRESRREDWKVCNCFHVRTLTISIGIWDLVWRHMLTPISYCNNEPYLIEILNKHSFLKLMDFLLLTFYLTLLTYDPASHGDNFASEISTVKPPVLPDLTLPIPRSKFELLERLDKIRERRLDVNEDRSYREMYFKYIY